MKLTVSFLNEGFEKKLQSIDTENCENKKSLSEFIQDMNSADNTDDVEFASLDDLDFNEILEEDVLEEKKADQRFGFGNQLKFRPYNVYFFNGFDKIANTEASKLASGTMFEDGFRVPDNEISGNKLSSKVITSLDKIMEKSHDSIQSYIVFGKDAKTPIYDSMAVGVKAKQDDKYTQNATLHVWKYEKDNEKAPVDKDVDVPGVADGADSLKDYKIPLQRLAQQDDGKYYYIVRSDNNHVLYDSRHDKDTLRQMRRQDVEKSGTLYLHMLFNPHDDMNKPEDALHKEPFDLHPQKRWRVDVPKKWRKQLKKFISALYEKNGTVSYDLRDFKTQKQDTVVFMTYGEELTTNPEFVSGSEASNYTDNKEAIRERVLEWLKATDGGKHAILGNPATDPNKKDPNNTDPSKTNPEGNDDPNKKNPDGTGDPKKPDTDVKTGDGWESLPDELKKHPAVQKAVVDAHKEKLVKNWQLDGDILSIYFSDGSVPLVQNIKQTDISGSNAKAGEGWDSLPNFVKDHPFVKKNFDTDQKRETITTWIITNKEITMDLSSGKEFRHTLGAYGTKWDKMPKDVKTQLIQDYKFPAEKQTALDEWYIVDNTIYLEYWDGGSDSFKLKGGSTNPVGTPSDEEVEDTTEETPETPGGTDKKPKSRGKGHGWKDLPDWIKNDKDVQKEIVQKKRENEVGDWSYDDKIVEINFTDGSDSFDKFRKDFKSSDIPSTPSDTDAEETNTTDGETGGESGDNNSNKDGFSGKHQGTGWESLPDDVKKHPKVKKAIVDEHKEKLVKEWTIKDGLLRIWFSDGSKYVYDKDDDDEQFIPAKGSPEKKNPDGTEEDGDTPESTGDEDPDNPETDTGKKKGKGKGKGKDKGQETGEESDEESDENPDEESDEDADDEEDSDENTDETGDGEGKSVEKDKNYHKGKGWDKLPLEIKKTEGVKKEIIGKHRVEVVGDWEYNDELVNIKFTDNSEEYTGDRTILVRNVWDKDDIGYGWEMLPDWAREKNPDVQKEIVQKQLKNKVGYWTISDNQLIIEFTDGRKKLVIKLEGEHPHHHGEKPVEDPEEGEDPSENPDEPEKPEDEDTEEPEETSELDDVTDNWLKMYALNRTGTGKAPGKGIEQGIPSGTGAEEVKKKLSAASMSPENKDKSDVYVVNPKTRKIDYVARNGKVADIAKSLKEALKSDFDSLKR